MAYYPLKVKDDQGNTHVVGDPRTANKADKASPALTGTPTAPTAAADTNTTQLATTAYVVGQASSTAPSALGTAAVGDSLRYARANHVHAMPTAANVGAIANSLVAAPNGVASLDSAGQVPASQLGNASGGATGGGTDEVFYENAQTVTTNYTITSSRNALSAGPITIGTGVTVTVPSGSVWAIV